MFNVLVQRAEVGLEGGNTVGAVVLGAIMIFGAVAVALAVDVGKNGVVISTVVITVMAAGRNYSLR